MSLPQEPTGEQRTVLVDTGIGYEMMSGEGLAVTFFLGALLVVVIFRLSHEAKSDWHARRITNAAQKAASRWAATKPKS